MKLFDETLKEMLPKLRAIENPKTRISATRKAYKQFRKLHPDSVGCARYFAKIEVDALDEQAGCRYRIVNCETPCGRGEIDKDRMMEGDLFEAVEVK